VQIRVKPVEEKGEKPLRVSQASAWPANGQAKDVLLEGQYRRAKAKGACPNTKAGVLIDGKEQAASSTFAKPRNAMFTTAGPATSQRRRSKS
jgi:hypothetical protein